MSTFIPARSGRNSYPWVPDLGDGTYQNPILCSDYPDPDVIRHGQDYYLVVSSFNHTPGLPILHSKDLVNWAIVNHAINNLPHSRYETVHPGCGIWAPSIRYHAGKFWIFFSMPDEGIYWTTADHPGERWSEPYLMHAGKGLIDPCPLWDDDGNCYLVHAYAKSRSGIKHRLRICPMAPDGSRLLDEGRVIFESPKRHPTIEGPKFVKKDGYYYILAPAGGVEMGWQLALRSKFIYGPYEEKIVLEQGSTLINGPHQGGLVDTPDGNWWFLHFQDVGLYGRITHLQPVEWKDGWPLMGIDYDSNGIGEPVAQYARPVSKVNEESSRGDEAVQVPQTSDDFNHMKLGQQWHWNANHSDQWYSLASHPGWLRLFGYEVASNQEHQYPFDLRQVPQVLMQKLPARSFKVEACLDFRTMLAGQYAGLTILGRDYAALAVHRAVRDEGFELCCMVNHRLVAKINLSAEPVRLLINIADGGDCELGFYDARGRLHILCADFKASAGVWIGARVGIFTLLTQPHENGDSGRPYVDFDYLRFSGGDDVLSEFQ